MLFKNKKGIELTLTTIIVAVVLLFVMVVVLLFFGKFFGLEVGILTPTIGGLQCDGDGDGIKDSIDICACDRDANHQNPSECATPTNSQSCQASLKLACESQSKK